MNYVIFIDSISLAFAAASVFILRKRMAGQEYNGYLVFLFPLIPALFIVVQLAVCINVFTSDITAALSGLALFTGGMPLYYLIRRKGN